MSEQQRATTKKRLKKRFFIVAAILGVIAVLVVAVGLGYKAKYPYGWSHCCIIGVMNALEMYANEHAGHYPTGEVCPEASLSLLCRSNYLDAYTIRGMTVPEKTVRAVLDKGGLLGPETCGWHYTDGLTLADDPRIALLYCKQPLGHNGQTTKDGSRQVVYVGGNIDWVSGDKWASFLQEQTMLLSKRGSRAKSGKPLVDAIIELPDGSQIGNVDDYYALEEQDVGQDNSSGNSKSSGNALNRDALIWFNTPMQNNYSGVITRTLSFSNLVSAPVTVTFANGTPDKTNVVFKMHSR